MIVIGLSSGTSADGIDVAAARFALDGDLVLLTPLGHRTEPYPGDLREAIRAALPPARTTMETVCRLDTRIGRAFADAALRAVGELAGGRADLVASHGQTLFHWADQRADHGAGQRADGATVHGTLQLGQPAWIAEATGLPVVSDLRTADVAAGGQGAPLASLLDALLLGARPEPTAALNLGGIANVTVLRGEQPPLAFDTGPGNALLDAAARRVSGGRADFDADGAIARSGRPDPALLEHLLAEPYYRLPPPRTTGLELFGPGYLDAALHATGTPDDADLMATLVELTAATVADALRPHGVAEVLASGGGTRNPVLMERLAARLSPARLAAFDTLGLDSDAKEAYLFALIGFLTWHGLPGSVPSCTGARRGPVAGRLTPGASPLRLPEPASTVPARLRVGARDLRAPAPHHPE
ncbi:anhydro-N-acetylmuramic acid kinase [Nocardiopsis sp. HUAS JQ3]|uniref:anhydro-N-acetylmuramic acid kinase n=1 Tax=Nocardiopsis sp. HUAS JQ3 TaxID=3061629 RepID=UPI0023A9A6F2|nr:anhydro-N-acetylmuramic acid kinase [Nocardiopsis sp. HUAS JQ3]WDZ93458.1 anhydro-N-acetylmuramic acid kinase [Nocardiopsis sp. HUAS JQ3]